MGRNPVQPTNIITKVSIVFVLATILVGCSKFPSSYLTEKENIRYWKVRTSEKADYLQYLNKNGKVAVLGFDEDGDGRVDYKVDFLSAAESPDYPHYVILLDGIPFSLIDEMYKDGHFRLFYPPQKLISVFPPMTDLAYAELFGCTPLSGFEALYYDREKKKLSNADLVYLSGKNAPWQRYLDYRAPMILDPIGYINPDLLFNHEMNSIEKVLSSKKSGTVLVYSVGTATIATRKGKSGLVAALERIERLCEKLTYMHRGRLSITILSDHGHNLTESKFFDLQAALKKYGFRPSSSLKQPEDVVLAEYGLITAAFIYSDQPDRLASSLIKENPVELATYLDRSEDRIVVLGKSGRSYIYKAEGGWIYNIEADDPLELGDILERLRKEGKISEDGVINDSALFTATIDHKYPDPLYRLWRCFHGQAIHQPDVVLSIKDGWFCGKESFAKSIDLKSTHGGLNWKNSVTFIMTTIKPIPQPLRIRDARLIINAKNIVIK